jgi:phosphate starvation-inducible PhoH-like protein
MGPHAKMIITGDVTQIDLPRNQQSGLPRAAEILKEINGIGVVNLTMEDVVRHRLVRDIIQAYGEIKK